MHSKESIKCKTKVPSCIQSKPGKKPVSWLPSYTVNCSKQTENGPTLFVLTFSKVGFYQTSFELDMLSNFQRQLEYLRYFFITQ
jgi:hypothetical protein